MCLRHRKERCKMADKWVQEGVRGDLTNDTVFIRNTETGQRESVCTQATNDREIRDQQVGRAIANGNFNKK
jgi:hypothetical protein